MFGTNTTQGGLWGTIENDIGQIFGTLTQAADNNINQQLNPGFHLSSSSLLLIGGVVILIFVLMK